MAVAFVLRDPAFTSAIIGSRTAEHLDSQIGASDVDLADDVLDRIDQIVKPGTNFSFVEAGYEPPGIAQAWKRRRPLHYERH